VQRFQLAAGDIHDGAKLWRLSWALGMADIKVRYRGSMIGPFWLTLSTAVMVGSMAFLYAALFSIEIHIYLPYLTVSILFWNYLNMLVADGCTCFTQSDSLIKGLRMPFTVHVMRSITRNTIILMHNMVVLLFVFLILRNPLSFYALWAVPALLLWIIDAFAISLLLGALCARFRDIPQIIASIMQIAFFVTPIIWQPNSLAGNQVAELLVRFNPFYYLLQIIQSPLLGTPMALTSVANALIVSGIIVAVSALAFTRMRGRIGYWV
jgi:lipopolysaccharide transport system permease protein